MLDRRIALVALALLIAAPQVFGAEIPELIETLWISKVYEGAATLSRSSERPAPSGAPSWHIAIEGKTKCNFNSKRRVSASPGDTWTLSGALATAADAGQITVYLRCFPADPDGTGAFQPFGPYKAQLPKGTDAAHPTFVLEGVTGDCWFGDLKIDSALGPRAEAPEPEPRGLTHGPIVGRAAPDSMRVWVRTGQPMPFRVVYDTSPELTVDSLSVEGETLAEDDNTGTVDLAGLTPDTVYHYGVAIDGELLATYAGEEGFPHFRTLPAEATTRNAEYNPRGLFNIEFGVAFGNALGGSSRSPVYGHLLERHADDLDFFIMNGDYIYEWYRRRKVRPPQYDFDAYRVEYRHYLDTVPHMARFFQHVPMLFVFDDHELGPEQITAEIGFRVTPKNRNWSTNPVLRDLGIKVWYEYCGWATFDKPFYLDGGVRFGRANVQAGSNVLFDPNGKFGYMIPEGISTLHMHINSKNGGVYAVEEVLDEHRLRVRPAFEHTEEGASYSLGTHHFYDWRVGNAHFFVIDARTERTMYDPKRREDPEQVVLGKRQLEWLLAGIENTDADFVFIVSSVNWMVYHNASHVRGRAVAIEESPKEDGLSGALVEREKILNALDALDRPALILTGDLHSSFAIEIADKVWEFMTGPIASGLHPIESAGSPPFGGKFETGGREVDIRWANSFPLSLMEQRKASKFPQRNVYGIVQINNVYPAAYDEDGETIWAAYDKPQVVVQFRDAQTDEVLYAHSVSVGDAY